MDEGAAVFAVLAVMVTGAVWLLGGSVGLAVGLNAALGLAMLVADK